VRYEKQKEEQNMNRMCELSADQQTKYVMATPLTDAIMKHHEELFTALPVEVMLVMRAELKRMEQMRDTTRRELALHQNKMELVNTVNCQQRQIIDQLREIVLSLDGCADRAARRALYSVNNLSRGRPSKNDTIDFLKVYAYENKKMLPPWVLKAIKLLFAGR
jgi:hypothetical protein